MLLYQAYELRRRMLAPLFGLAALESAGLRSMPQLVTRLGPVRGTEALIETFSALEVAAGPGTHLMAVC